MADMWQNDDSFLKLMRLSYCVSLHNKKKNRQIILIPDKKIVLG